MTLFEELIVSLKRIQEQTFQIVQTNEEKTLSQGQVFLLFKISRKERIKTTDISQFFGITAGAATAIADKLENLGFIQRERDNKDRRIVYIVLSEDGKAFVRRKKEETNKKFAEILGDFPEDEILAAIHSLNNISDAIHKHQSSRGY